jgi:hypothetical protein
MTSQGVYVQSRAASRHTLASCKLAAFGVLKVAGMTFHVAQQPFLLYNGGW